MKKKKGFFEGLGGAGEPSGSFPVNAWKPAGVKPIASAGNGRPVSLANAVRIHRINV
jgi:hypothetical protein